MALLAVVELDGVYSPLLYKLFVQILELLEVRHFHNIFYLKDQKYLENIVLRVIWPIVKLLLPIDFFVASDSNKLNDNLSKALLLLFCIEHILRLLLFFLENLQYKTQLFVFL